MILFYPLPSYILVSNFIYVFLDDCFNAVCVFYLVYFWYSYIFAVDQQIYRKANSAYDALSTLLGEESYLLENR